jgi:hypothetical protein
MSCNVHNRRREEFLKAQQEVAAKVAEKRTHWEFVHITPATRTMGREILERGRGR